MRTALFRRHRVHEQAWASELLGPDHPLVGVLEQLATTWTQSLVVAAVLLAGVVALLEGVSGSVPLVVGAAVVQAALACRGALLTLTKHERAIDVIAEGRDALALDAVERQRRRLLRPRHRRQLASALDDMRREATHPMRRPAYARPLFDRRVIAATAPELGRIASLLRGDDVGARGVAMIDRHVVDGGSALYRGDAEVLREELRRIEYFLQT